jgi:hypothetical protein
MASPSSRRWSSVEDLFGSGLVSSVRDKGSVKLIANIRSRATPLDSIRHSVVIHNGACSPLPCANRIGGSSVAAGAAALVWAAAPNPKLFVANGSTAAPFKIVRRDMRI